MTAQLTVGEVRTAAINDRYDAIAAVVYDDRDQTPISERKRRTKLTKLVEYDFPCLTDSTSTRGHNCSVLLQPI